MPNGSVLGVLSGLSRGSCGVFRGDAAVRLGVSRRQVGALVAAGVLERLHPDTYRLSVIPPSNEQLLWGALLWAGPAAVAAGRSAGELYPLEGVHAAKPEIVVPLSSRLRSTTVVVHRSDDRAAMMIRRLAGLPATGVEATLLSLARTLDDEAFEIAFEDARRRGLTSVPALQSYVERFGSAKRGVAATRRRLTDLDPVHAQRSTLEVKTRRLLVANGFTDFVREFPLQWNGRVYRYDFCFERARTILETNGRRWHDDPADYEDDNDKWSVPGRHGYRIVFVTWGKVTRNPDELLRELTATIAKVA